ncbi:unnamed protein product, partial [Polarella glacialis]
ALRLVLAQAQDLPPLAQLVTEHMARRVGRCGEHDLGARLLRGALRRPLRRALGPCFRRLDSSRQHGRSARLHDGAVEQPGFILHPAVLHHEEESLSPFISRPGEQRASSGRRSSLVLGLGEE